MSDDIVCTIDLSASLAHLVGQPVPEGGFPDSENVLGALLGDPEARGRTSLVQQDNGSSGRFGYREGTWKLVRLPPRNKKGADMVKAEQAIVNEALYDLDTDPGETTDVRDQFPDVAAQLAKNLDAILKQ